MHEQEERQNACKRSQKDEKAKKFVCTVSSVVWWKACLPEGTEERRARPLPQERRILPGSIHACEAESMRMMMNSPQFIVLHAGTAERKRQLDHSDVSHACTLAVLDL